MSKTREILEARIDELTTDPLERAKVRMGDAFNRGGVRELLKATQKRLNAITSIAKAEGLIDAIWEVIRKNPFRLKPDELEQLKAIATDAQRRLDAEQESVQTRTSRMRKLLGT